MAQNLEKFINDQLSVWPEVANRYRDLKNVSTRQIETGGLEVTLQHNPARIASATAKLDPESLKARRCFLCEANEPAEQIRLPFLGRKGRKYNIHINPYPVFPRHIVIARVRHREQSIWHHFVDILDLAKAYSRYIFFYNGPKCGASAPDHHHFQGCPRGLMPLERAVDSSLHSLSAVTAASDLSPAGNKAQAGCLEHLTTMLDAELYHFKLFTRGVFVLRSRTAKSMAKLFYRLLECAPMKPGDKEPRFNLFTYFTGSEFRTIVTFRDKHLSHHYFSGEDDRFTMSLGCADMAGFVIVPKPGDYQRITPELLSEMLDEVSITEEDEKELLWRLTRTQRTIDVGIMAAERITFEIISDGAGPQTVSSREGKVDYNGVLYDELYFDAVTMSTLFAEPTFILHDVTIGIGFHWERKQKQSFAGSVKFIADGGKVLAINTIGIEDYLLSVISSEMKASASLEFLKAHAVISRSWVISQIDRKRGGGKAPASVPEPKDGELIRWWDHDDHSLFDVCADDHCQRYQGLTMAVGDNVRTAIDATWGQVLTSSGAICDARFSKCCGGVMERFSTCWEDCDYDYLQALPDTPAEEPEGHCFCDTADTEVLAQVLNDYDLETMDFYRWDVRYSRAALSELVSRRTGILFGEVRDLVPLERGESGRIRRLRIVGSTRSLVIGKELMIRRSLSESHLKSSAFDIDRDGDDFILHGRGWGHGVGLCQIGAAVMACSGYDYGQILGHYYPGSEITRL